MVIGFVATLLGGYVFPLSGLHPAFDLAWSS